MLFITKLELVFTFAVFLKKRIACLLSLKYFFIATLLIHLYLISMNYAIAYDNMVEPNSNELVIIRANEHRNKVSYLGIKKTTNDDDENTNFLQMSNNSTTEKPLQNSVNAFLLNNVADSKEKITDNKVLAKEKNSTYTLDLPTASKDTTSSNKQILLTYNPDQIVKKDQKNSPSSSKTSNKKKNSSPSKEKKSQKSTNQSVKKIEKPKKEKKSTNTSKADAVTPDTFTDPKKGNISNISPKINVNFYNSNNSLYNNSANEKNLTQPSQLLIVNMNAECNTNDVNLLEFKLKNKKVLCFSSHKDNKYEEAYYLYEIISLYKNNSYILYNDNKTYANYLIITFKNGSSLIVPDNGVASLLKDFQTVKSVKRTNMDNLQTKYFPPESKNFDLFFDLINGFSFHSIRVSIDTINLIDYQKPKIEYKYDKLFIKSHLFIENAYKADTLISAKHLKLLNITNGDLLKVLIFVKGKLITQVVVPYVSSQYIQHYNTNYLDGYIYTNNGKYNDNLVLKNITVLDRKNGDITIYISKFMQHELPQEYCYFYSILYSTYGIQCEFN